MGRSRFSPRRRGGFCFKLVLAILILGSLSLFMMERILGPVFTDIAQAQAVRICTRVMNQAIQQQGQELEYHDIIRYEKNEAGRIVLMQPNIPLINHFSTLVAETVMEDLYREGEKKIQVPLGYLLGMRIFSGFGPYLSLDMVPYGFVEPPMVYDVFEGVGINQTRHRIYIEFRTRVQIIMPLSRHMVEVDYKVPITEVTIMGEVPDMYLNLEGGIFHTQPEIP